MTSQTVYTNYISYYNNIKSKYDFENKIKPKVILQQKTPLYKFELSSIKEMFFSFNLKIQQYLQFQF